MKPHREQKSVGCTDASFQNDTKGVNVWPGDKNLASVTENTMSIVVIERMALFFLA